MCSIFLPGKVFLHKDQTQKARFVVSVPGILGFCVGMWLHRESRSAPKHPPPPSHPSFPPQLFLHLERLRERAGDSSAHRFQFHSPCQLPLLLVMCTLDMVCSREARPRKTPTQEDTITGPSWLVAFFFFFQIFIGVELICSVVFLFSGAQQSESALHIHTPTLF